MARSQIVLRAMRLRSLASILFVGISNLPAMAHEDQGIPYDIDFYPPTVTHCYVPSGSGRDFFSRGPRLRVSVPSTDNATVLTAMQCAFAHKPSLNEPQTYFKEVSMCAASRGLALDPAAMSLVPSEVQPGCQTK